MSRMQKFAEWLSKGYYNHTPDEFIENWSPNNVKTVLISGDEIAVEYFVPYMIENTPVRLETYKVLDLDVDLKQLDLNQPVKGILKALSMYKIYGNLEEIIISSDKYTKQIFSIDSNIKDLCITGDENLLNVFPRLYSITKTTCTFSEIYAMMANVAEKGHAHYSDFLDAARSEMTGKQIAIRQYNKDNWCKAMIFQEENYAYDAANGELHSYLKAVLASQTGEVDYDDVIEKKETMKDFFTVVGLNTVKLPEIPQIKKAVFWLEFMREDMFNSSTSPAKARTYFADSIVDSLYEIFNGLYSIKSLTITSGNQILVNNDTQIIPMVTYSCFMNMPDNLFNVLMGMSKEVFNRKATERFKHVPDLDSDIEDVEQWLVEEIPMNWGYIFDFKHLSKFENLSCLRINNPWRISSAKGELGIAGKNWSTLYEKMPNLETEGIYLDGAYISKETEGNFISMESALADTAWSVWEYNKERGIMTSQFAFIEDDSILSKGLNKVLGKNAGNQIANKVSGLSAKLTTLYRKFDV